MRGPGFGSGERWMPYRQDLRALVDALETFFGFRDGLNRGNPKLLGARSMQRYANALPTIFHAQRGTRDAAAEAQVLRPAWGLEKTIWFSWREKIQYGLD